MRRRADSIRVESGQSTYTNTFVTQAPSGGYVLKPAKQTIEFKTESQVSTTGLRLGWQQWDHSYSHYPGFLANKHNTCWAGATARYAQDQMSRVARMFIPRCLTCYQWLVLILCSAEISAGCPSTRLHRAKVMEWDLQDQLNPLMSQMKPLPNVCYPDFINARQEERADNVLPGSNKQAHSSRRPRNSTKSLYSATNTEKIIPGVNDTAPNMEQAVRNNHDGIYPSTLLAMACIYESAPYVNGAPQNTFVPGCAELAEELGRFIGGHDFKSGQTKIKSCLAEFLVNSGIKPLSIASYNHLVSSSLLSNTTASWRCEYLRSSTFLFSFNIYSSGLLDRGGRNKIVISNVTCQDSLLAIPLILDLVIITKLLTRVQYRKPSGNATEESDVQKLYPVLSLLSSMLKASLVRPGPDVINGAARQRAAIDHFLMALLGLQPLTEWEQSKIMA
ncbi:hypothetical protein PtB15_7B559 [Puccinia triticina]|nr:hypothetical protein PtB15_7B559 [Puccinia triticina]